MKTYYLETMPHVNESMRRVEAWYHQEVMDRAPIRFSEHNGIHNEDAEKVPEKYQELKDYWFDAEYQVESYIQKVRGVPVYAETFPVFYPNLGPGVYASFYGVPLKYGRTTSWAEHIISEIEDFDISKLKMDDKCENWKKIDELTDIALKRGSGIFFTGYTDLHPSLDCTADLMGVENLCLAILDSPEEVIRLTDKVCQDFTTVYDYYAERLKGQPSVSWMGIPSEDAMHIPSCDFCTMLSEKQFEQFALPYIEREVKHFKKNIFHMDGRGVARHLDKILSIPEIQAIQWVQGVGDDEPIMQWVPLIRKIQAAGKSVVVSLKTTELKEFMRAVNPKGIYLTMPASIEEQPEIVELVEKWR